MERYSVFVDWRTQHCEEALFFQTDVQNQCNCKKNYKLLFFFQIGTWQNDSEIYLEVQGVKNNQTLLKKKNKVREVLP